MFRLYICLGLVALSFEFENLALNKPAYQQHPYSGPIPSHLTEASNAVDGLHQNLSVWGGQCVYSDDGQQTATLMINLTRIFSINSVVVSYMLGDSPWGPSNEFTSRFLGFSIYVSNTTEKLDGILFFKEHLYNTSTLTSPGWDIGMETHGQYVFYYNERLKGKTYPDDYSTYAYNDICELKVMGCSTPGLYGYNCSIPCPDLNCRNCHTYWGRCWDCKPGYQGYRCEQECDGGHFGERCQSKCGHCANIRQCDNEDGTCLNGCTAGYMGAYCKKECPVGFFGQNCSSECNKTCKDCNNVDGLCDRGCHSGWKGDNCEEKCNTNMYGANCSLLCGNCRGKGQCHHVNGSCLEGCDPGFQGNKCSQECPAGFFGQNCSSECNKACKDCNNVDGLCDRGCHSGWKGDNCGEKCNTNKYGANCDLSCGNCREKGQCHHVNGSCLEGCDPGFQGDKCLQVCGFGYYGLQCLQECSTFCKRSRNCHHVTGFCNDGCKSGWQGNECFEVLSGNAYDTAWQSRFYGMTGALCVTFAIFITYVMFTRKAKNGCFKRNDGKKSTKQKESHYIETYENEAADHGYQEMGEFHSSPAIYYNAE
uniref:Multiple epidermal growth factor-like domains protein 11 isoform X2 n=1 Tax=Crassostrea virginica TaxID=6565 RepID=A0A8B8BPY2_CRAVI|nr:multiple epidermal growth factor-like domains protein 11 isoform X2 [Crassostrea virginica]